METIEQLLAEVKELKQTILAGYSQKAYELVQNLEDELTTILLKSNQEDER